MHLLSKLVALLPSKLRESFRMTFRRQPDIEFHCPHCRKLVFFHPHHIGSKGKCPYCEGRFIVPSYSNRAHPAKILPVSPQSVHPTRDKNSTFQVIRLSEIDIPPSKPKPISFRLPCSDRSSLEKPLDIFCPRCHKLLTFSYDDLWNKGTCPDCGSYFTITEPDFIAEYFADVKSASVNFDEYDDVDSSDFHMSDPPARPSRRKFYFSFDSFFDPIIHFSKLYFSLFGIVFLSLFIFDYLLSQFVPLFGFTRSEVPTVWFFVCLTSCIGILVSLYFFLASLFIPLSHHEPIDWNDFFVSLSSLLLSIVLSLVSSSFQFFVVSPDLFLSCCTLSPVCVA